MRDNHVTESISHFCGYRWSAVPYSQRLCCLLERFTKIVLRKLAIIIGMIVA